MIIPKKTDKMYPDKPWVSKSLERKKNSHRKKIAFQAKDNFERKRVQSKLRKEIRETKKQYKEKHRISVSNWQYAWRM